MATRTEVFTQVAVTGLLLNSGLALVQSQLVAKVAGTGEGVFAGLISAVLIVATFSQISKLFVLPESAWIQKLLFRKVVIAWAIASVIGSAVQLFAIVAGGHALMMAIYGLAIQLLVAIGIRKKMAPKRLDEP